MRNTSTISCAAQFCVPRPSWAGKQQMVEAGGQLTRSFRLGLDYAFIPVSHLTSMRSVLSGGLHPTFRILVLTPTHGVFGESISLYRAGLKLALFLPLGVAMPPSVRRCRQVSPM
jgi:hypothetical protein